MGTWTSPTDDIIVQEGTFAFDYDASGTVYGGQAVYCSKEMSVGALPVCGANALPTIKGCVGVAAYKTTDGKPVAVYGPGNIVRVVASSNGIGVGDTLIIGALGKVDKPSEIGQDAMSYMNSGVKFIALEASNTVDDTIKVLIC